MADPLPGRFLLVLPLGPVSAAVGCAYRPVLWTEWLTLRMEALRHV